MKKLFVAVTLVFCASTYAQDQNSIAKQDNLEFKSKSIEFDDESTIMELKGDASFKNEDIEIKGADKIVFDTATEEVVATGNFSYTFNGSIQAASKLEKREIRYKLGDDIAYLN